MAAALTRDSRTRGVHSSTVWCLFLLLWFSVVVAGTNWNPNNLDMAEILDNPVRMLRGELPYRDFWLLQPPGEVLLPAALYRIGFDIDGLLRAMGAISVAIGLLAFAIARPLFGTNPLAALTACLFFFNGLTYRHQGFLYIHAYLLALLVGAFFLHRFWQKERGRDLLFAGLGFGLGLCFRFYYSGGAIAACCLVLLWRNSRQSAGTPALLRTYGIFAAGLLVFPVLASLALHEVFTEMAQSVVVDSVLHGTVRSLGFWRMLGQDGVEFATGLGQIFAGADPELLASLSRTAAGLMIRLLPFVLLACGAIWFESSNQRDRAMSPAIAMLMLFALWGALVFVRGYTRGAVPKLSHAATPWFLILVFLFCEFRRLAPSIWTRAGSIVLSILMLGLVQEWVAITSASASALANPGETVTAPYGTLTIEDANRAQIARDLIRLVIENSDEDDYLFVTRGLPLYGLTRRRNPTYYDSLIELVYQPSDEQQRAVCSDLNSHPSVLIVHKTAWGFGGDPKLQFAKNCPILNACIVKGFPQIAKVGPYQIRRRDPAVSPP